MDENGENRRATSPHMSVKIDVNENEADEEVEQPITDVTEEKIAYQQRVIEETSETLRFLEEKCTRLEHFQKELESKLEAALKQKETAVKEKEVMVIKYAVGEKNVIREQQLREQAEKKQKELQKENEILQHRVQTMVSEKARICQMLDNKCYELKGAQQELDKAKTDLTALETQIKWSQNSLKSEMEAHKECQAKVDALTKKVQNSAEQIDEAKKNAEDTIKSFMTSQDNRAYALDQQVKEMQASLILFKHEKADKEEQIKTLRHELERAQTKQKETIYENNGLSQKVQQLERERLDVEQKLSELRCCSDQQRQDAADLQTKSVQLEQLRLQLKHEQDQRSASNDQIGLLKLRNQELEQDMEACRVREAELLLFTQQLTDKNVRLQSEFSALETKVRELTGEQTALKRRFKEQETKTQLLAASGAEEKARYVEEIEMMRAKIEEQSQQLQRAVQEAEDQKGEKVVVKRKLEHSLREVTRELQHYRKKAERGDADRPASASPSPSTDGRSSDSDHTPDRQALIEHIVKLQRISAKKSEKIDFLEEHVASLVAEVQAKAKLLQAYALREPSGTMTSNATDKNKTRVWRR
ncbi:coiled-coil domain-containing protein 186 isoform X2 [Cylas formicarius]|uniref:coiled-coil domain-containing protein 186 isoform X2 n=1 Tax=Cylas formicarius TaxID=197179 RepID=UPI0029587587|nr:coiled-coil domain-containing protein 186 isoform X2 [Cylas formicarius]